MVFCIYFTLTWVLFLLLNVKSSLPFKLIAFLFLIICLIHTHTFILIPENFKGFFVSSSVQEYLSYIILRTLIVPASFVLCILIQNKPKLSKRNIFFLSLSFSFIMAVLDLVGETLNLYDYLWWNFYWSFLYFYLLFMVSYFLYILFLRVEEAE
jgi:hypothetical protein